MEEQVLVTVTIQFVCPVTGNGENFSVPNKLIEEECKKKLKVTDCHVDIDDWPN